MNLGQIKSAFAEYSHRVLSADQLAMLLSLAEQRIYFGEANAPALRCSTMISSADMASGVMPEGFLSAIKITKASDHSATLDYCPLERLKRERQSFSWDGQTLVLSDDQAFPVRVTYYKKFTPLASDSDVNWLSDNAPGVYLSSVLIEFAKWSRDDELGAREAANYSSMVGSLMSVDKATAISGSRLVARKA